MEFHGIRQFFDQFGSCSKKYQNVEIIDGEECEKDKDKCFTKINDFYATVKENISVRVYKKTLDPSVDPSMSVVNVPTCITSLILPPKTKVHFGDEEKNRAEHAFVESSVCQNESSLTYTQKWMKGTYPKSFFDKKFKYPDRTIVKPTKEFFDQIETTYHDRTCNSGIHFFLNKEAAQSFDQYF
jgi:hypothetical protein